MATDPPSTQALLNQLAATRFRAVVFDLDGTLIDSLPAISIAVNRVLEALGRPALDLATVGLAVGDGAPMLMTRILESTGLPPADAAELDDAVARYEAELQRIPARQDEIYPGVLETLDQLTGAGMRLGICSNKPSTAVDYVLTALHLADRFQAVIGGETVPQRKPAPEPLLHTLDRLGATPATGVMVGDSASDIGTARAAGVPVVAVSYGYPRMPVADLGADLVIDRMADLGSALVRLDATVGT